MLAVDKTDFTIHFLIILQCIEIFKMYLSRNVDSAEIFCTHANKTARLAFNFFQQSD